jgi:hypothetical protein
VIAAAPSFREPAIPRPALLAASAALLLFAGGAIAAWLPGFLVPQGAIACAIIGYSAAVLSFASGARFGAGELRGTADALMTITPPLAAWIALALPVLAGVSSAIAAFLLGALWAVLTAERGIIPLWTGKLASLVAAGAVLSLLAILLRLLV